MLSALFKTLLITYMVADSPSCSDFESDISNTLFEQFISSASKYKL